MNDNKYVAKTQEEESDDKLVHEFKKIAYPEIKQQLDKIEQLLKNFPLESHLHEKFQMLIQGTYETFIEKQSLLQFERALEDYVLESVKSNISHETKENRTNQRITDRLYKFKMWEKLNTSFQNFKKILGIIPDLKDEEVKIYFWEPGALSETGHVSLGTAKIYASFWPEERPEIGTGYSTQGMLQSYAGDVAEEAKDSKRDTGKEDKEIVISGLNVDKINERFLEFQNEVKKSNLKWSLLSHRWIDKYYPNTNRQNCSGLVAELLEAGEIRKLISGFRFRNSIMSTIARFLYTKELGPVWMGLPALYLRKTSNFSVFIPLLICGLSLFSTFLCLNRFKRNYTAAHN